MNNMDKKRDFAAAEMYLNGFLGSDNRTVAEIVAVDKAEIEQLGHKMETVVSRMKEITAAARVGLGSWIRINDKIESMVEEAKGVIECPFESNVSLDKRITIVRDKQTGKMIKWSDLNLHLAAKHGFFEGKGAFFRIEPKELTEMIF